MLTEDTIEQVILVDKHDRMIGQAEKLKAHKFGQLHRAFSIFIFRKQKNEIQLLLQQRNSEKYHCGGLWTNTCCSHPRITETMLEAANRRLKEEMDITTSLKWVGKFCYRAEFDNGLTEHELDHVFIGFYEENSCSPDSKEVSDYKWIDLNNLQIDLKKNANSYTPWFAEALEITRKG